MEREEKRKLTSTKWAPASLFRQFTWIDCSKIVTITKLCELAIAAIIIANTMDGNGNEHWSMNSQNHTQCTHTRITAHTDRIQMRLHVKIFQVRMKKQQNKYGAQSLLIGNFFLFAFTYWAIIYFLWGKILVCLMGEIVEKCTLTHWSVGWSDIECCCYCCFAAWRTWCTEQMKKKTEKNKLSVGTFQH